MWSLLHLPPLRGTSSKQYDQQVWICGLGACMSETVDVWAIRLNDIQLATDSRVIGGSCVRVIVLGYFLPVTADWESQLLLPHININQILFPLTMWTKNLYTKDRAKPSRLVSPYHVSPCDQIILWSAAIFVMSIRLLKWGYSHWFHGIKIPPSSLHNYTYKATILLLFSHSEKTEGW